MNTKNQSFRQLVIGRNVLILFALFLLGSSINAGSLPGQIIALPSYLVIIALDIFEMQTGLALNNVYNIVLVAVFYLISVVLAASYSMIKRTIA